MPLQLAYLCYIYGSYARGLTECQTVHHAWHRSWYLIILDLEEIIGTRIKWQIVIYEQ